MNAVVIRSKIKLNASFTESYQLFDSSFRSGNNGSADPHYLFLLVSSVIIHSTILFSDQLCFQIFIVWSIWLLVYHLQSHFFLWASLSLTKFMAFELCLSSVESRPNRLFSFIWRKMRRKSEHKFTIFGAQLFQLFSFHFISVLYFYIFFINILKLFFPPPRKKNSFFLCNYSRLCF